jgi:hypothetical protein
VLVPRPADRRAIRFEHCLENFQAGRYGKLHELGTCIDEQIDERQMALGG